MMGGSRTGGDERGLSNVVGVTILIGLVITGSVIVVTIGGGILDDVSSQTEQSTAEDSMLVASGEIDDLTGSSVTESTSFSIPSTLGGDVGVNESGATVSITVADADDPTDSRTETRTLGTVYYRQDGNAVALQGSGVWQQTDDGPMMLSQPSLSFSDGQLALSLLDFGDQQELTKGEIVVTHDSDESRTATRDMMQRLSQVWTDSGTDEVDVTVTIESQFAQAWASYARNNMDGDVTVETPSPGTTVLTFAELPAAPTQSPPITTGSTVSTSPSPPTSNSQTPRDSSTINRVNDPETSRSASATPPDSDGDGIVDSNDACPQQAASGLNGCPVVTSGPRSVTVNTDGAEVTYLGTQSGTTSSETVEDRTGTPVPRDATFVIDETGSMVEHDCKHFLGWTWDCDPGSDPNGERNDAVRTFVDELTARDRAAAIQFTTAFTPGYPFANPTPSSSARTVQSLTGNHQAVKSSLSEYANGGTDIAAGIEEGIDQHDTDSDRMQIMVVLSDGQDNTGADPRTAARNAADENITIYSVGLGDEVDGRLREVASITGGEYYHVDNAGGLEATFEEIEEETTVRETTNYYVDHDPVGSSVGFGGESWSPVTGTLNDPRAVNPVDPYGSGPRPSRTFGVQPGATLDVQTTYFDCQGGYTDSSVTQSHDGETYTHRGCTPGASRDTTGSYRVLTDGDAVNTNGQWWQDLPSLLPADASIDNGGRLSLPADSALVRVDTNTQTGYALYLVEATGQRNQVDSLPVAELSVSDGTPLHGETVTLDASASFDPEPDDSIRRYRFGDGEWQSSPTTTRSFEEPTDVTLTVENTDGERASTTLHVATLNRPARANLSTPDATVFEGETVTLDASTSSDPTDGETIVDYEWSSNVDSPSGATATTTFTSSGTKTVSVTVESADGSTATTELEVEVQNRAPVAELRSDSTTTNEAAVTLDASGSHDVDPGDTLRWEFDVVDAPAGSTAALSQSGATATLDSLLEPGVYRAEVTVTDNGPSAPAHDRASASASVRITVRGDNTVVDVGVAEMDVRND